MVKLAFFNGNGVHDSHLWYTESEAFVKGLTRVYRENKDGFSSLNPVAYVETMREGVYANKFPVDGKVLYTLYNSTEEGVSGNLIEVEQKGESHFVELFTHKEVGIHGTNGKGRLASEIRPKDVICIAELPGILVAKQKGQGVEVSLKRELRGTVLRLHGIDENANRVVKDVPFDGKRIFVNFEDLFGRKSNKLVIQLLSQEKAPTLIDETIMGPFYKTPPETVWIDGMLPEQAGTQGTWKWDKPVEFAGKMVHFEPEPGERGQHLFKAAHPLRIPFGSKILQEVYLDPQNPPSEIMLRFKTKSEYDERGFDFPCNVSWGENMIPWGKVRVGDLPTPGKWAVLEITDETAKAAGGALEGMGFVTNGGKAYWGKTTVIRGETDWW
jgi:hypothetical protein